MRGKKAGVALRKLLTKIQGEFYFPKVYVVRCRVGVRVRNLSDQVKVKARTLIMPEASVRPIETSWHTVCKDETLKQAECLAVTPLSGITTEVESIACFQKMKVDVKSEEIGATNATVITVDPDVPIPNLKEPEFIVASKTPISLPVSIGSRVRGGPMLARNLPFRRRVIPMRKLGMKRTIRYRAAVLKQLSLKPAQVKFIGVVTKLPTAPLSIMSYEEGTKPEDDHVIMRLRGATDALLKQRAWVIVRIDGKESYQPITVKEEE